MKFLSDILARAGLVVDGTVTLNSVANATTDTDRFIVVDSGVVKYRTGTQLLSDIGGISGNQTITLSGDATGSGTTSIAVTLANSGVTAGTYGSSTAVPVITVDAKGRVTSVTTASISGSLTFTGDVTGSGTTGTTTTLTLANSGVTAGTYNNVTVNAKGLVTSGSNVSYLTSYTETDTLATVTGRGASTSTRTTFVEVGVTRNGADTVADGPWFRWTNADTSRQMLTQLNASNGLTTWAYNGATWSTAFILSQAGAGTFSSSVTATSFIRSGGTSSQFLKADGSVDSTTYQSTSQKGQANGYASLDGAGKVPIAQLPSSIMEYKGTWNASTNSPSLADGTGDTGDVYRVSTAGTRNLGSGSITFDVGDYVIYNGTIWEKSDTTDAVASVNGFTGVITLTTTNIAEGTNLYYTDARARAAITLTTTGTSGAATYSGGVLNIPQYQPAGSYLTAESDTLATVTGRGATTSTGVTFNGSVNTGGANGIELGWTGNTINDQRIGRIRPISTPTQNPYAGGLAFDYYKYSGTQYQFYEGIRLTGSGNVGIGTTTPSDKLTIYDTVDAALGVRVSNGTNGASAYTYIAVGPAGSSVNIISYPSNASARASTVLINTDSSVANGLLFTTDAGPIRFSSASGTGTQMHLNSSGNLGVGTSTPGYRLHVLDSANFGTIAIGNVTYPTLLTSNAGSGEFRIDNRSSTASGFISFYPNGQATTLGDEAMRITTGRSLLIGATSQGYNPQTQGYLLGVKSNTTQAFISVAKSGQTLDSGGIIYGLDTTTGYAWVRENIDFTIGTNNTEKVRITAAGNVYTAAGSSISYGSGETYIIWNNEAQYGIIHSDANWKDMKTFIPSKSGSLKFKFSAYISSGTYYWAWRIRLNGTTTVASGHYNSGLDTGQVTSVHAYRRFVASVGPIAAGDSLVLQMISSGGDGTPTTGNGQTLYAKEFRAYSTVPNLEHGGSNNIWGDYVGIGTTAPTYKLHIVSPNNEDGLFVSAANSSPFNAKIATFRYAANGNDICIEAQGGKAAIQARAGASTMDLLLNAAGGYVGIGTTAPATPLHVLGGPTGTGSWNKTATLAATYPGLIFNSNGTKWGGIAYDYSAGMRFWVNASNDDIFATTNVLSILNNGNVGINSSAPTFKLEVGGTTYLNGNVSINTNYNGFALNVSGTTYVIGGHVWVQNGYGYTNSGSTSTGMYPDSSHNIDFKSNNSSAIYINSSRNIGINTTSPVSKLEVYSNLNASTFTGITVTNGAGANTEQARAGIAFKGYDWVQSAIWHGRNTSAGLTGALVFGTNPDTTDLTVNGVVGRMWILNNGNVGIATSSPAYRFQVQGPSGDWAIYTKGSSTANNSYGLFIDAGTSAADSPFMVRSADGTTTFLRIQGGGNIGILTASPANKLQIGSVGSSGYGGNDLAIGNGTQVMAFYQSSTVSTWYTNTNFSLMPSGAGGVGNLAVGTSTASNRLTVSGSADITNALFVGYTAAEYGEKLRVNGGVTTYHTYTQSGTLSRVGNVSQLITTTAAGAGYYSGLTYTAFTGAHDNTFNGSVTIPNSVGAGGINSTTSIRFGAANVTVTMTQSGSFRSYDGVSSGIAPSATATGGSISHVSAFHALAPYYVGSNTPTITNYFGLLLNDSAEYSTWVAVTNRWGIYQHGSGDNNYFAGKVMVGTTTVPTQLMYVNGTSYFNGNMTVNGTITELSTINIKTNVETLDGALDKVEKMRGVSYNRKDNHKKEIGFIAEEVDEVYPEFVEYDEQGNPVGLHYARLTAVLLQSVKELSSRIKELEKRN